MKRIQRAASVPGQPKESDLWRTPPALFEALNAEFGFDIDLAANAENHLCPRWLGPGGVAEDALAVRWADVGRVGFLNCPYSKDLILRFMPYAARQGHDMTIVSLTPHDSSTIWWDQSMRWAVEIRELPHRVPYLRADGASKAGAMFSSAIAVFRPQPGILRAQPRRVVWSYRPAKPAK